MFLLLHSSQTYIVVHKQLIIFLDNLFWKPFCCLNNQLVTPILPKLSKTYSDRFSTEQLELVFCCKITFQFFKQVLLSFATSASFVTSGTSVNLQYNRDEFEQITNGIRFEVVIWLSVTAEVFISIIAFISIIQHKIHDI